MGNYNPCFVGPWPLFLVSQPYRESAGLLGRGISPSQSRYRHTEKHKRRINAHRHPHLQWNSNPWPQCSSGRRQFIPQTAWPLWSVFEIPRVRIPAQRSTDLTAGFRRSCQCQWSRSFLSCWSHNHRIIRCNINYAVHEGELFLVFNYVIKHYAMKAYGRGIAHHSWPRH
jgi:hypothetical protein